MKAILSFFQKQKQKKQKKQQIDAYLANQTPEERAARSYCWNTAIINQFFLRRKTIEGHT